MAGELGDWAAGIDVPFVVKWPDGRKAGIYLSETMAMAEAEKVGGTYRWANKNETCAFYGVGADWWRQTE